MTTTRRVWFAVVMAFCMMWSLHAETTSLDLYILRHAQTMANVTRDYSDENQRIFSPVGLEQIASITEKLDGLHFDHILVSPIYRAMHTILPYLKAHNSQAEIWPELAECCWEEDAEDVPVELKPGVPIEITDELAAYFRLRDDQATHQYDAAFKFTGPLMAARAHELILERFGGSGQSILLVTHYHTGQHVLNEIMDHEPKRALRLINARLSHLKQNEDGTFRLLTLNDVPYRTPKD